MSEKCPRGSPGHGLTWQEYNEKFGNRIAQLEETVRKQRRQIEGLIPDAQAGKHFKQLMRALGDNVLARQAWDRFMVTLRMVGMDQPPEETNE